MVAGERVVLTGGSGFVGSAVMRALVKRGFQVSAVVRQSSSRVNIASTGCEIIEGDIRDEALMLRAMAGARFVFHVAADYRLWAPERQAIYRNNVEGTRSVMRAAAAAKAERIIYTSSVATLKPLKDGDADETSRLEEADAIGAYKRSKVAAQRLVESMIGYEGLPAVIVSPSTPIGPGDIRPTPTGRTVIAAATGLMPAYVDTGLNLVHVDDVAAGHLGALEHGRIGENYILGGENVPLKEMLTAIALLSGKRPPRLALSRRPLFPLAYAAEAFAFFSGREPLLTVDGLKMAKERMFFTSAKAVSELGYSYRPYVQAIADALKWFRQAGYLR